MTHHVVIEKLCACAKKNSLERIYSFDTKEEAQEYAYQWADKLNNSYCGKHGFDVVEVGDDALWNYEETVIALRNPHWAGAEALAKALQTTNVIPLENKRKLIDATVYIGKDFHKIIGQEQP